MRWAARREPMGRVRNWWQSSRIRSSARPQLRWSTLRRRKRNGKKRRPRISELHKCVASGLGRIHRSGYARQGRLDQTPSIAVDNHERNPKFAQILLVDKILIGGEEEIETSIFRCA